MSVPRQEPALAADGGDLTGRTIGRFVIRALIGRGGMGEVYRADDTKLRHPVALKRLKPQLRDDPHHCERILNEAQRASAIDSRHLPAVHDVIEQDGEVFLVMEYVEGESLRQRLEKQGPMAEDEFVLMAIQCADALAAAHRKGVVHRDIKPDNIMLTPDGTVKVLDFGVAKRLPLIDEGCETGSVGGEQFAGTLGYMAPEVLLDAEVDHRADIFSLGVVFQEALTGRHPFRRERLVVGSRGLLAEPAAEKTGPPVPAAFAPVLQRMLAKDPEARYANAEELARVLRRFRPAPRRWSRERRRTLAEAALVVATAVVAWLLAPPPVTASFHERDWVLIADFDNSAGEPVFDKTLKEALTIALEQSSYVNTLPRPRVVDALRRMQRDETAVVDEALGRELCQREAVRVLLAGSIARAGSAYQIRVRAVDPPTGRPIFTAEQRFGRQEELFEQVDALAKGVRQQLGESLPRIERSSTPLAQVTTRSVEALQLYSRAADDVAWSKVESAESRLQAALALDPDFAMAHYLMANVYQTSGNREKEAAEMERAYQLRGRVTERERYLIEAEYEGVHGRFDKTAERLETLVSIYPDSLVGLYQLAVAHFEMGKLQQGIDELRRVVELNPHDAAAYGGLVLRLAYVNSNQEALQVYQRASANRVQTARLEWGRAMALLGEGRTEEARRVLHGIEDEPAYGAVARIYLASADELEGKLNAAVERLHADLQRDSRSGSRSHELVRRYHLARIHILRGERKPAQEQLDRIASAGEPEDLQAALLQSVSGGYAALGDVSSIRRILRRLRRLSAETGDAYNRACERSVEADLALAQGHPGKAIELFQASLALFPTAQAKSGLARAHARRQDWEAAAQAWDAFLKSKGEIVREDFAAEWVLAHLELARAYRRLGDAAQARSNYRRVLQDWKNSDSTVLQEASREMQELGDREGHPGESRERTEVGPQPRNAF